MLYARHTGVRMTYRSIHCLRSAKPGHQGMLGLAGRSGAGSQTALTWSLEHRGQEGKGAISTWSPRDPSSSTCPKFIPPAHLLPLFSTVFIMSWVSQSLRLKPAGHHRPLLSLALKILLPVLTLHPHHHSPHSGIPPSPLPISYSGARLSTWKQSSNNATPLLQSQQRIQIT